MRKISKHIGIVLPLVSALLVGCGGNDGNTNGISFQVPNISTQQVVISSANEGQVAQAAFDGSQGGLVLGSNASGFMPVAAVIDSNGTVNDINLYRTVKKFVDATLSKHVNQQGALSVTGAEFSGTDSCAYQDPFTMEVTGSGSETFHASVADINQQTGEPNSFSIGDYFTVTFNNCDYGDGVVQNGSMSMTFNSNVNLADINAEVFSMDVTVSFNNLRESSSTSGTETLHGTIDLGFDVSGTSVSFDMSGNSFYAVSPNEAVHITNFSFVATTDGVNSSVQASFTIASTTLDGQITVGAQFSSSGSGYPTTGSMTVTGGNSSQLVMSVNNDGTTVNVTLTVNGMPEAGYPKDVAWSELGIEANNVF